MAQALFMHRTASYSSIMLPMNSLSSKNSWHCLESPMYSKRKDSSPILQLTPSDLDFLPIQQQFMRSWKHPDKPKPEVCAIFRILSPEQSLENYSSYLLRVAKKRGLANVEELLFHGTSRSCRLGETKSNIQLCTMPECFLCCIIRESFHVDKSGTSHSFQRFGKGIYTTSCSSKADSYFRDVSEGSPFRMVLVNRVVVGKPRRVHHNRHRTLLPASYDSLIGVPGEDLNYDETVVYKDEAIRPAYLIVYAYSGSLKKTKATNFISKIFRTPLFDA
ncbi:hypothetical protein IW261DRAFT_116938 [Armillaria novae-zelandiae]|uniref:PARP catalytic domain-containing protein n=1 Tax=Armillaria novae-zelandiae TaxID=153914 RepID=A0AA39UB95_9AGAR|nr:hypothetical protein IW261DRAFT_116938 [Armillaria novae-zelandiae]